MKEMMSGNTKVILNDSMATHDPKEIKAIIDEINHLFYEGLKEKLIKEGKL